MFGWSDGLQAGEDAAASPLVEALTLQKMNKVCDKHELVKDELCII